MNHLILTLVILGIIVVSISIIAVVYITAAARRRTIVMKKLDYLIEDVTHKSEILNPTVETVSKVSNYVDAFEVVARKNMKSAIKIVSRNKEDFYKVVDRLKKLALGENNQKPKKSSKSKSSKKTIKRSIKKEGK